jgi:ASCH domain
MKTLSIRQPWADLILQGQKTLELRTWTVSQRGLLAIHASQTVEREACKAHGLDPERVTTGAVIGVVDLVAIDALDAESFATRRAEHLSNEPFPTAVGAGLAPAQGPVTDKGQPQGHAPTLYGWRLLNPRPLSEPVAMHGRMSLFEAAVADPAAPPEAPLSDLPPPRPESRLIQRLRQGAERLRSEERSRHPFELQVVPKPAGPESQAPYRLALHQRSVEPHHFQGMRYDAPAPRLGRVAGLGGVALRAVAGEVIEALRENGYKPSDLSAARREPFALSEESGVRLALLFLAVRRLTKVERMDVIAQAIRAMTSEEAYYWDSKCTGVPAAERAQQALRVLLADE